MTHKGNNELVTPDGRSRLLNDWQDTNAFRKVFCREVGERPVEYRNSFKKH